MKFENTEVFNFEGALRGMRNPMNSWHLSDSYTDGKGVFHIGEEDLDLAQRLVKAGSEHRKFMRQIFVSVDITAPIYWWKEFDTYKVGTVANSTSTMHKIHARQIDKDCFETDDYDGALKLIDDVPLCVRVEDTLDTLEQLRQLYLVYKEEAKSDDITEEEKKNKLILAKKYWKELIRWTPAGWLQTRTVTMSYENILTICKQRRTHKLNEWSGSDDPSLENFVAWAKTLPYAEELIFISKDE